MAAARFWLWILDFLLEISCQSFVLDNWLFDVLLDSPIKCIECKNPKVAVKRPVPTTLEQKLGKLRDVLSEKRNFLRKMH